MRDIEDPEDLGEDLGDDDPRFDPLKNATALLMEHFDSVQIMATKVHRGCTHTIAWGAGNYDARFGMVSRWVEGERAKIYREAE